MFTTVLIANRGEIACRVIETLRTLGIRSVAVYSDADAGSRHVSLADTAVRIGPANAAASYLSIENVIAAAHATGAQAIHPGYGFLAENADFAAACADAGIVFIGPGVEAIRIMGDKISAKAQVAARGVPIVPGLAEPGLTDSQLEAAALEMGFPVLIKPSAGGGGKGMHLVEEASTLVASLAAARREAASSFGDDSIFIERYIGTPRHIEVQILADRAGNVVHLGERECSLQRRHQKVIEEAPSPLLDAATRHRIGEAACETARSVGYEGVGTVEFIVAADSPDDFFFMEMNTRLQVEHPVTEMITGRDLVEWQLRVAAGELLDFTQDEVVLTGHAIEARVYAEDAQNGFLPTGGTVLSLLEPSGPGIRVDSSLQAGLTVSSDYDPMLAKIIAWGPDRASALQKLSAALARTTVHGVTTNIEFLALLLQQPAVVAGTLDTGLIERAHGALPFAEPTAEVFLQAALIVHAMENSTNATLWSGRTGFRVGAHAPSVFRLTIGGRAERVEIWGPPQAARLSLSGAAEVSASVIVTAVENIGEPRRAQVQIGSVSRPLTFTHTPQRFLLSDGSVTWQIEDRRRDGPDVGVSHAVPELRSPMPGSVVAVSVSDGEFVEAGSAIVIVEAMKMEHVLRAANDGIVSIEVTVGQQVTGGELLATVTLGEEGVPA